VDVRPAAGVGAGEDGRERDLAGLVALLHAAQEVLVGDLTVVHRVLPVGRAVEKRRCRAAGEDGERAAAVDRLGHAGHCRANGWD
jgi:hypothetical protein